MWNVKQIINKNVNDTGHSACKTESVCKQHIFMPNVRPFESPFTLLLSIQPKKKMGEFSINIQWGRIRCKDHKSVLRKPEQKNKKSANIHP